MKMKNNQKVYQYYDMNAIKKALDISNEKFKKGVKIKETGEMKFDKIQTGYIEGYSGMMVETEATVKNKNGSFKVSMLLDRDHVVNTSCACAACKRYAYWTPAKNNCEYIAALFLYTQEYMGSVEVGDATDKTAAYLLSSFAQQHMREVVAEATDSTENMSIEAKLVKKSTGLTLTFKYGTKKKYVLKDLPMFCENVHNSATAVYGTNTELNHNLANFDEKSKKWYYFIDQAVQEEIELQRRVNDSLRYYYGSVRSKKISALELHGWRADSFYELAKDRGIEYEDRSKLDTTSAILSTCEKNPKVTMNIQKVKFRDNAELHGVTVTCMMPELFYGIKNAYYIEENKLCKADENFVHAIAPLTRYAKEGVLTFQIGRSKLTDFYYSFLPQLEEFVTVQEENAEEIHEILPPEASFVFFLDTNKQNITCHVEAHYGEEICSVMDAINPDVDRARIKNFRIESREREIALLVRQFLPYIDFNMDVFHCNGDEDLIYEVLNRGVDELTQLGEVRCTKSFKNLNIVRKLRMSVGVSLSNNLLDLEITSEDVDRAELLDILKGYKVNKKYYRLKNGDYLNVEDENFQMLKELVETMHLSPKEFIKGKLHLPVYRTLYLDKLLEEKDGIYTKRNTEFRKMVKNFKTVSDADFVEPETLSHVMRNYQKNGFKWMKLLGMSQFGGILADDMGLGKTLQAIAVLLSAKEEGQKGTSLVVAPSSLVFNWGEEFARFAPSLVVDLVTGDQKERQEKLEHYADKDVLVTSYDMLKRDISFYEEKEFFYEIIDEAQYIKNYTTAAAKAVKVINSRNRLALTGTPIENRLSELWSIFDYLMPGFLYSYEDFKKNIEAPVVKNDSKEAMERLQRMVGPFIMRRLKNQVLKDLPDKLEEIRYVKFDSVQQKTYDAQVVHMQEMLASQNPEEFNKNKLRVLAELTRIRQICCDPSLCFENYKGESAKLESCLELIQSAMDSGHKMLLFSQFTSMLEILEKRLKAQNIPYYVITGATSKEKRLQLVKAFNADDTPVFLISLKAGGVGLNLTGADVVIHYDPWWNIAVQNQATDRAHRIGQTKKVTVYKLIVRHSIEEKIQKLQESKKDLAEQVMSGETGQLGSMTREELLELLKD